MPLFRLPVLTAALGSLFVASSGSPVSATARKGTSRQSAPRASAKVVVRTSAKVIAAGESVTDASGGSLIKYTLPVAGRVSLAIYNEAGVQVRTLASGVPQPAGANSWYWDGLNSKGVPVAPGSYSWKLLLSQGMKAEYAMVLGTSTGIDPWPAQHGGIYGVAVQGDELYVTAGSSEGSPQTVKTTFSDKYQWATPSLEGWEGGQDISIDGDTLYFQSVNESSHKNYLYLQDSATGKVKKKLDPVLPEIETGKPSQPNRIDARDGELVCASTTGAIAWLDPQDGKALDSVIIPGGLTDIAIPGKGHVLALSGDKVLAVSKDNKTPATCVAGLTDPHRLAVDHTDGSLWVAEAGDSQQVKHFDRNFKLLKTLGRKGGRAEGLYIPQDFLAVSDIAADGKGGFVISESDSAPRRTAHFDGEGKLLKEWYGGQQYYTFAAVTGGDPSRIWMDSHWGWLTEVQVDWPKRSWKVRACYRWGGDIDAAYIPRFKMAQQFSARLLDLNKDGKKETYLTAGHFPGSLIMVDEAHGKLKPVSLLGEMGWDDFNNWPTTVGENAPEAWKNAMIKAGGDIKDGRSRDQLRGFSWADLNNDNEIQANELHVGNGQRVSHLLLGKDLSLYLNLDLGKGAANPAWQKLSPQGFTPSGAPIWDWNKRELGPPAGYNMAFDLREDASGNIYTLHQNGAGDGFAAPDTWGTMAHGISWPANLLDSNGVIKWSKDGRKLWEVGPHASRSAAQGRLDYPMHFAGTVNGTIGVCDKIEQPLVFWTEDGLFAGGLFDRRAADGLPKRVYSYYSGGTGDFNNETGLALIQSDMILGGSLVKLANGDVYFIGSGFNNCPVYRITGWDEFQRQSGTITVKQAAPQLAQNGEGLKGEYFDNEKLEGEPALVQTDKMVWADTTKKPPWMVSHMWPEEAIGKGAFSAQWTGLVQPKFSEDYTFSLYGRYGKAKLWIGGQLVAFTAPAISDQGGFWKVFSQPVPLRAGQKYPVRIERSGAKEAAFHFNWESASQPITHVLAPALYPPNDEALPVVTLKPVAPRLKRPGQGEQPATKTAWVLTRTGSTENPLDAELMWTGTARAGQDFERLPQKVLFKAGQSEVRVPSELRPVTEAAEGSKEIQGQLRIGTAYLQDGTDGTAKIILSDPALRRLPVAKITAEGGKRVDWAEPKIRADLLPNLINGSGLDRTVDPPLHDTNIANAWFCEFTDADTTAINFDLGTTAHLGDIRIWNLNTTSAHGVGWGQGETAFYAIPRVRILLADKADGPWTDLGTTPLRMPSGKAPDPGQLISVGKPARYVRFAFSNPTNALTLGLAEVEFYGTAAH